MTRMSALLLFEHLHDEEPASLPVYERFIGEDDEDPDGLLLLDSLLSDGLSTSLPVPPSMRPEQQTPMALASIVSLSGQLDDLADDDEDGLIRAAHIGLDYVDHDDISFEEWQCDVCDLADEAVRYGMIRYMLKMN
jgi:hypothetical protein